ncbi:MAG: alpha/beta fold hydrolase [Candidatus Lokiarchaeota archaeon]|nr:alpha/beta fold hydrolase [Candidatus Lokiarchaeota archaeon]
MDMKIPRLAAYIAASIVLLSLLNQVEPVFATLLGLLFALLLLELVFSAVKQAFLRFDDGPGTAALSAGKFSVEKVAVRNMHATLIKSHHTPARGAPAVIMHHGYGSTYRRMLVYAYPLALNGYAVLLYNTLGHGKVVKEGDEALDERTPGDKTEIAEIMRALGRVVEFVKGRPDLDGKRIGFVGISLGAIVGLTHGVCDPDIKCVIALAGVHDFKKTSTRRLVPFSSDWFVHKSFVLSGLEMDPTKLQDFIVSPAFYAGKQFGFFDHPVWSDAAIAEKVFLIHCEDDCTVPYFNFEENVKAFGLPPDHYLALRRGNHWFIRQEHIVIGQMLRWLAASMPGPVC